MQIEYINTNQKPSNLWLLKIIAKIILTRIPMMYQIWQRLGLFRHGKMDNAEYAIETFMFHIKNCNFYNKQNGLTILEIGPGDSVASALIAKSINRNHKIGKIKIGYQNLKRFDFEANLNNYLKTINSLIYNN